MDDLSDGIKADDLGSELTEAAAGVQNHCKGVNDRDRIKEGLDENVPDGGDVAIFDVDGAEEKGNAKSKGVEFEDERKNPEPAKTRGDAVDEGEDDNDAEVNAEVDKGGGGGGNNYNPFRKADFAKKIAAAYNGINSLAGTLGEKVPEDGAGHEVNGVMRDVAAHLEELSEDDIQNREHQKRSQYCPEITENGTLIPQLEVGFD